MTFADEELRMMGLAGPIWIRMLKRREERTISRIYGEFRGGKSDHLAAIAELACIRDLINDINNAIEQLAQLKGKDL